MVRQAIPMLCVLKKNGKLRTVFDLCMQNENTEKDISPFPDQDTIWHDIACATYRSKLDMSEAYEQIRVHPEDVPKTAFATIFGMFVSLVMQQGNCNAPSTIQRLMTTVFCDYIACFVHVYLDNIFIYSSSIEEHKKHLELVFNKLHKAQLYLSQDKVNLYSQRMDCLGHIISDVGIHTCMDKMQNIRDWQQPATITTSKDSLDSFDIWHISQILLHTRRCYRHVSETGGHLYGPHSSTSVLSLSKHSLARLQY